MVVGITGCYCSGKGTAASVFRGRGYSVVDVDRIGHEALDVKKDDILKTFGKGMAQGSAQSGSIDRKILAGIVFSDPGARGKLEAIVHPWMIGRVKRLLKENEKCVIDAALLIEMCLHVLCDFVLGIDIDEETAVKRGVRRDHVGSEEALKRLRAQIPLKQKIHFVDKIIDNRGDEKDFVRKVEDVIETCGL